jgi:lipid II:glycine glycyltransferase (peptidoglycan interpeptide bridge formation enzyme)
MNVFAVNPLSDARWDEFVQTHPASSVFHTRAWIEALKSTYGYEPVVFTTSPDGTRLTNGILCCHVRSWLTGKRLVSVPFADHCDWLVNDPATRERLLDRLREECTAAGSNYAELRLHSSSKGALHGSPASFVSHTIDLSPDAQTLFDRMHHATIQRKVRRALREGVTTDAGRSKPLLDAFFDLMVLTRRRHGLPPAPRRWFANLVDAFGEDLLIRVAFKGSSPIGAILTLRHRTTVVYKYGCSNALYHALGTMPLLMWQLVAEAKKTGARTVDLGRSDIDQPGLIQFKERLGSVPSTLVYERHAPGRSALVATRSGRSLPFAAHLPDRLLIAAGRLLYPHLG